MIIRIEPPRTRSILIRVVDKSAIRLAQQIIPIRLAFPYVVFVEGRMNMPFPFEMYQRVFVTREVPNIDTFLCEFPLTAHIIPDDPYSGAKTASHIDDGGIVCYDQDTFQRGMVAKRSLAEMFWGSTFRRFDHIYVTMWAELTAKDENVAREFAIRRETDYNICTFLPPPHLFDASKLKLVLGENVVHD